MPPFKPFCKLCGDKRYPHTSHALCEKHYLTYFAEKQRRYYRRSHPNARSNRSYHQRKETK